MATTQPTTAELLDDVRAIIREHDERKMAELRANRATLARIARMTGAEPPASHLRIVGDSEGVTPSYTPAEPKSDLQRTIDEADAVMERVRRRRAQLMGLDPDRFATVVSLDERRAGRGCQR